ncbi:Lrp/AsnC family transcriptional regulator [Natrialbaceae archaeon A-chndr2]|uniref:Lrp/AsnC family transcriptional regulator n=1 Tax=Natronosalvus amylolyticus TaxID=2961994 RepID=UPI0020C9740A|nr:Lrp/AsnC family transcriptional regulator [Natronosalvus amylolyticus]
MDKKDLQILAAIAEHGTGSPDVIEAQTDIPKSTVHYRLEKLKDSGVVKNDLYELDLEAIGLNITVITEVLAEFEEEYHHRVGEQLADVEGVNQVYFTMGDTDFIVIAHLASREMVESLIESYEAIEEIQRTSSQFVITTVKNESRPIRDFDIETIASALLPDT